MAVATGAVEAHADAGHVHDMAGSYCVSVARSPPAAAARDCDVARRRRKHCHASCRLHRRHSRRHCDVAVVLPAVAAAPPAAVAAAVVVAVALDQSCTPAGQDLCQ